MLAWELALQGAALAVEPWFALLLIWGYLQYKLVGLYRIRRGGGGPGMETPPERLVTSGPFALCRNPMYLGHLVFLTGLALMLQSLLGALITAATLVWFQFRVVRDERRLRERFGQSYVDYTRHVKRWLPGVL